MLKPLITLIGLGLTLTSVRADILIIGDSHSVGPFGTFLHQNLAAEHPEQKIMLYGHSSSAPIHWMSKRPVKLPGGINHHMSFEDLYLPHPKQPRWQIPQPTLSLLSLIENPVIHSSWKSKIPAKPNIDTVVIALGANDRNAVSTNTGARTQEFKKRVEIVDSMLNDLEARGIRCIWIAPPSSSASTKAKEATSHEYLLAGIKDRCPIYDSRKFVARHCDKLHFNCPPAMQSAKDWAREASDFITDNL